MPQPELHKRLRHKGWAQEALPDTLFPCWGWGLSPGSPPPNTRSLRPLPPNPPFVGIPTAARFEAPNKSSQRHLDEDGEGCKGLEFLLTLEGNDPEFFIPPPPPPLREPFSA